MIKTAEKLSGKFTTIISCQLFSFLLLISLLFLPVNVFAVDFPGPDSFGYTGALIPLNLRDISTTGTDVDFDDEDDGVAVVSIGFSFVFYGVTYTEIEISTNGFITFSPTEESQCCSGEPIPDASDPNNYIAGWWEDLDLGEGGIIRTQLIGTPGNQEFVIGFYGVRDNDDPDNVVNTFEIILHEGSNDIELAIDDIQFDDVDDKVTGIENADGTDGIEVIFVEGDDQSYSNGDSVISNQGYLFSTESAPMSVPTSVPTVNEWGMVILSLLMAGAAFWFIRKESYKNC